MAVPAPGAPGIDRRGAGDAAQSPTAPGTPPPGGRPGPNVGGAAAKESCCGHLGLILVPKSRVPESLRRLWSALPIGPVSSVSRPWQVNEYVDARDTNMGAWFEAQVVRVTRKAPSQDEPCSSTSSVTPEDDIIYHVKYDE